jgi:hypothetical protein
MQYYLKVYNLNKGILVGYYKSTGLSCISKLPKGIKYFNNKDEAILLALDMNYNGFMRDSDGKYYTPLWVVCGDHTREPKKNTFKNQFEDEDGEFEYGFKAYLRQNRIESKGLPGGDI